MKEIAVTDEQYAYIDGLREALKTEHVGRYGHVRMQDAIQYLVDTHAPVTDDGEDSPVGRLGVDPERDTVATDDSTGEAEEESEEASDADGEEKEDDGDETGEADEAEDGEEEGANDDGGSDEDEGDGDGEDRLSAMMNLLDAHTEKWGETPSEQGRYEVKLPDGELEVVQTRDDVRAVLFKNYR